MISEKDKYTNDQEEEDEGRIPENNNEEQGPEVIAQIYNAIEEGITIDTRTPK